MNVLQDYLATQPEGTLFLNLGCTELDSNIQNYKDLYAAFSKDIKDYTSQIQQFIILTSFFTPQSFSYQ